MHEGCYLDTSFLLKAYVQEQNSADVVRLLQQQAGRLVISSLTDVEIASGLFRKLPQDEAQLSLSVYRRNRAFGSFQVLPLTDPVYSLAQALAEQYSGSLHLRSLDLIHLAAALYHGVPALATFDEKLRLASEASGLYVIGARP